MATPTADASDLTDLASVESLLQLPPGNADEQWLQLLITGVSENILEYSERYSILAQAGITETRNGKGADRMMFRNQPVFAVTSLTIDGVSIPAATSPTTSGFVFDSEFIYLRGIGTVPGFQTGRFNKGVQNIAIVESCGWLTPGQQKLGTSIANAPLLPGGVKLAATEWVGARYKQSKRVGETGTTTGQTRVNYDLSDMPKFVKARLDRFILHVPILE
jgi:hypothetical protein